MFENLGILVSCIVAAAASGGMCMLILAWILGTLRKEREIESLLGWVYVWYSILGGGFIGFLVGLILMIARADIDGYHALATAAVLGGLLSPLVVHFILRRIRP